jgi:hypothetical protein
MMDPAKMPIRAVVIGDVGVKLFAGPRHRVEY